MTNLVTELMAGRSLWFGLDYAPHPELPADGHLTLAYIGKLDEPIRADYYATERAMQALNALPQIANYADDLKGDTDGWARFAAPDKGGALVVLVKFSGDWAWRMRAIARDISPINVPVHWTPHITVRYFNDETPTLIAGSSPSPIKFTAVTLNCGDFVKKEKLL